MMQMFYIGSQHNPASNLQDYETSTLTTELQYLPVIYVGFHKDYGEYFLPNSTCRLDGSVPDSVLVVKCCSFLEAKLDEGMHIKQNMSMYFLEVIVLYC